MSWMFAERRTAAIPHVYGRTQTHTHTSTRTLGTVFVQKIRATLNICFVTWHTYEWMQYKRRLCIHNRTIQPHKHTHIHTHSYLPVCMMRDSTLRTHTHSLCCSLAWLENRKLRMHNRQSNMRATETDDECTQTRSVWVCDIIQAAIRMRIITRIVLVVVVVDEHTSLYAWFYYSGVSLSLIWQDFRTP